MGRQAFAEVVDRVSVVVSQEKTRTVKLSLQKDRLVFSARAMDGGSSVEEMPVTYQGEPFEIGFNARYVLDALQQIQGETFLFCFKDATTPVVLKDKADDHVLYVLMPMRG
jgi:DNA polymerase-3 subunit beta